MSKVTSLSASDKGYILINDIPYKKGSLEAEFDGDNVIIRHMYHYRNVWF